MLSEAGLLDLGKPKNYGALEGGSVEWRYPLVSVLRLERDKGAEDAGPIGYDCRHDLEFRFVFTLFVEIEREAGYQ
jgi:hypothetical protein